MNETSRKNESISKKGSEKILKSEKDKRLSDALKANILRRKISKKMKECE